MASRWDHIYDLKPVPLTQHFVTEAAKLVIKDLERWPLAIEEWATEADAARFKYLLESDSVRPPREVYRLAIHLTSLELQREIEQIDDFMRNERWRAKIEPGAQFDAMILISRYLLEQMLAISEATEGRIKRCALVELLEYVNSATLLLPEWTR